MGDTNSWDVVIKAMEQAYEVTDKAIKAMPLKEAQSRDDIVAQFGRAYELAFAAIRETALKSR
jgi:hypothetical protein